MKVWKKVSGILLTALVLLGSSGYNVEAAGKVLSYIDVVYTGDVRTTGGTVIYDDLSVKAYYMDGTKVIGRIVDAKEVGNVQILGYTLVSGSNTITVSYTENGVTRVGRCIVPASDSVSGWVYDKQANQWTYRQSGDDMAVSEWIFDGAWYYMKEDGFMATGWVNDAGNWYYLYEDGSLAVNTLTPDGYRVDASGVWMK